MEIAELFRIRTFLCNCDVYRHESNVICIAEHVAWVRHAQKKKISSKRDIIAIRPGASGLRRK